MIKGGTGSTPSFRMLMLVSPLFPAALTAGFPLATEKPHTTRRRRALEYEYVRKVNEIRVRN